MVGRPQAASTRRAPARAQHHSRPVRRRRRRDITADRGQAGVPSRAAMGQAGDMAITLPFPVRVAAGILATGIDGCGRCRRTFRRSRSPWSATPCRLSMKVQQEIATLATRGDEAAGRGRRRAAGEPALGEVRRRRTEPIPTPKPTPETAAPEPADPEQGRGRPSCDRPQRPGRSAIRRRATPTSGPRRVECRSLDPADSGCCRTTRRAETGGGGAGGHPSGRTDEVGRGELTTPGRDVGRAGDDDRDREAAIEVARGGLDGRSVGPMTAED